ncbi:MAG: phosphoribosyltransferase [Bacillota bacterium]
MLFTDRREAGELLATRLAGYLGQQPLVFGIPRGGVTVAAPVASRLAAPLDVVVPRKLTSPHNEELAIGAVAEDGTLYVDETLVAYLGVTEDYLRREAARQIEEIRRRTALYRRGRPPREIKDRTVILVDDGVATGYTVLAAMRYLRRQEPRQLILAVPVAAPDTLIKLREEADRVVIVSSPEPFYAVGQFYRQFDQTTDDEVIDLLEDGIGVSAVGHANPELRT